MNNYGKFLDDILKEALKKKPKTAADFQKIKNSW
ncbi:MAG: hypothetical protein ACD_65C00142G0004, partial [uncultured bacterium]